MMISRHCFLTMLMTGGLATAGVTASAVSVDGDCNPNLAGRADGYTCCNDIAPDQSPIEVVGLTPGTVLTFSVTGTVSHNGGPTSGSNPDGAGPLHMTNYGDGISAPSSVRLNALMGVFLGPTDPTGLPTPPRVSFADGLDFGSLAPGTRQIFFIGDGLTSDSVLGVNDGATQLFTVPIGATRLFLGTSDGTGWNNNTGQFDVEVFEGSGFDTDGDGVVDGLDNCIDVMNADQTDVDVDGHGNICDADFNNDCAINFSDLQEMKDGFFGSDPELDLNSNGGVNFADLMTMKALFFGPPGPSAADSLCNP